MTSYDGAYFGEIQAEETNQAPAPKRRRWPWPWLLVVAAAFLVGLGIGGLGAAEQDNAANGKPAPEASTEPADADDGADEPVPDPEPAPEPEPEYVDPKPENFDLKAKILDKQCFGSAGCVITYRIMVEYLGTEPIDPDTLYEVVYEVSGVEDGPQIGTFELTDGESSVQAEEVAQTSSSDINLTVKATDVL